MRGKAILDFQTAKHQNGIAVKLNGKYPYDDGIESSWERKKITEKRDKLCKDSWRKNNPPGQTGIETRIDRLCRVDQSSRET